MFCFIKDNFGVFMVKDKTVLLSGVSSCCFLLKNRAFKCSVGVWSSSLDSCLDTNRLSEAMALLLCNCFSFDAEFDHDVPHVLCLYNTVYPCDSAGSSVEIFCSLELLSNIPGALYPVLTVLQEIRAIQST